MHIRIGTRSSNLALAQTDLVIKTIQSHIDFTYEIIPITTTGDKIQDKPLYDVGGKALFLKELEEALLDNRIDCAIHSMKDVPGQIPAGLKIAAVLEREDPRDVLLSYKSSNIKDLPQNAKIGTSSVRRRASLLHLRPDIEALPIRGNVETRIRKWQESNLDGIILAAAGLKRLGLFNPEFCHPLSTDAMLPAVGQGVIAIEIRENDEKLKEICALINHLRTWHTTQAERGFLEYLDADCRTPLAAFAEMKGQEIYAKYMLAGDNLEYYYEDEVVTNAKDAYQTGVAMGRNFKGRNL